MMATNDVPGANPANMDSLHAGCWAEHPDGSHIFVLGAEGGTVTYDLYDVSRQPPMQYRDRMPEADFKKVYTWKGGAAQKTSAGSTVPNEKWTWHDKTPFPWDKIIDQGFKDGVQLPPVAHLASAADRVREALRLRAERLDRAHVESLRSRTFTGVTTAAAAIRDKMSRAFRELGR